jgi:hypothetical protein
VIQRIGERSDICRAGKMPRELGPVVYIYNPSYSGGRDQEECGLKPAPGK